MIFELHRARVLGDKRCSRSSFAQAYVWPRRQGHAVFSRAKKAPGSGSSPALPSREHLDDLDGSCPLIGLPSDAARGGEAVKTAYRQVTESMIRLFEANLSGPEAREQALVFVALCVGGMVLARGIDDRALGDELRKSAERHILAMTAWEDGQRH